MKLQTPKGFRDFLPQDALKRKFVLEKIIEVFERFGFDPLETPVLEYLETLKGKIGEEEKLIFQFKTPGEDEVALKYDQTIPLSRVVAQYGPKGSQKILLPFKRYQTQNSYRAENTQKGRYREFLQCDIDIVGTISPVADAEVLAVALEVYRSLGLDVVLKINDRALLEDIETRYLASIDKLNKIGRDGVLNELGNKGLSTDEATRLLEKVNNLKPTEKLDEIISIFSKLGYPKEVLEFDPTLIRGFDYYTGLIFEIVVKNTEKSLSIGGGGRYDKLIGRFSGEDIPAVGFAVGFDRTVEALEELGLLITQQTNTQVLITIFSPEYLEDSLEAVNFLRDKKINTEVWLDLNSKLEKQLKYADQKGIPYIIIIGPDESKNIMVMLKDLKNKKQEALSLDGVVQKLSS